MEISEPSSLSLLSSRNCRDDIFFSQILRIRLSLQGRQRSWKIRSRDRSPLMLHVPHQPCLPKVNPTSMSPTIPIAFPEIHLATPTKIILPLIGGGPSVESTTGETPTPERGTMLIEIPIISSERSNSGLG